MRWFLCLLCLQFAAFAAAICLEDGIGPLHRRNLSSEGGLRYPVGIWVNQWASGEIMAAMAQILIEEKLGFHVFTQKGPVTLAQMYAIAGCKTPTVKEDRGCEPAPKQTYFHVGMEGWTGYNRPIWDDLQRDFQATAPVNVGHIGYNGEAGQYVMPEVLQPAQAEGLYLEFYRSYNASHHPGRFFHRISAVKTSDLKPCNETYLVDPALMKTYLEVTGDLHGVELLNGTVRGKCFQDYFWFPPACRLESSSPCFLFLTSSGYEYHMMMQRATIFDMPVVPVDVLDWNTYTKLAMEISALFYWWEPDPTFIGRGVQMVSYPRYNGSAWDQGLQVSMTESVPLEKYVSYDLEVVAPTVKELISAFSLNLDVVNGLLLAQKIHISSAMDTACSWLKESRTVWEEWLPDTTKCFPQFGLFDELAEVFLHSREGNTSHFTCKACPSGTFSAPLRDKKGLTFVCRSCAPGFIQSLGASTVCEPCPVGQHQEDSGASTCSRCAVGSYQNATGQSLCKKCPEKRTTLGLAAEALAECVCKAGLIEVEGQCVPCIEGLHCPIGSTIEGLLTALPSVNESDDGAQRPRLLPGYNSDPQNPLAIYRCRDHCPGGSPGSCSDGYTGVTCAECPRGTFESLQGRCAKCVEGNTGFWLIAGAILLLSGVFPAYVLLTEAYSPKSRVTGVVITVLGLLVTVVQNLLVIRTAPTTWPSVMLVATNVLSGVTLDPQLVGAACVGFDAVTMYFLRVLVFPVVIGILLLMFAVTQLFPSLFHCVIRGLLACYRPLAKIAKMPMPSIKAYQPWTWYGTACVIGKFCQVTFPTMANVGLSPMMCYSHPGGQMWSVVSYSSTACGTNEHVWMLIVGGVLLTFTTAFLVLCIWAGHSAPRFSLRGQAAVKFLFEDFRPDMVFFGVVTLMRGACLSLPSVFVPNRPNVQLVMMHSVMLISLVLQGYCQPWKSPVLNLVDTIAQCLFLTLLGVGLGGLEHSEAAVDVLHGFGTMVCISQFVVFGLVLSTLSVALLLDKFFRSEALGRYCTALGEAPNSALIMFLLENLASSIQKNASHRRSISSALDQLGTHDARMILMALVILESEIGLSATKAAGISLPRDAAVTRMSDTSEPSRVSAGIPTAAGKRRKAKRLSQVEFGKWMQSQECLKSQESQGSLTSQLSPGSLKNQVSQESLKSPESQKSVKSQDSLKDVVSEEPDDMVAQAF